jgi:hypothetical protein
MIENATRAAWHAVFTARDTLHKIQRTAEQLAADNPTAPAALEWLHLAGAAWAAGDDALDLIEADELTPGEIGAWLARVDQIEAEARTILP